MAENMIAALLEKGNMDSVNADRASQTSNSFLPKQSFRCEIYFLKFQIPRLRNNTCKTNLVLTKAQTKADGLDDRLAKQNSKQNVSNPGGYDAQQCTPGVYHRITKISPAHQTARLSRLRLCIQTFATRFHPFAPGLRFIGLRSANDGNTIRRSFGWKHLFSKHDFLPANVCLRGREPQRSPFPYISLSVSTRDRCI